MDTDAFDCKFLFQEYFMKLPVVNRSFFLFFFCFFPLFLSPVASEETITQLTVATSKIKLNRVVVCTRFVGIRKSQNGSDTSELQSVHILYLQAHQNKLKYINYGVMCELHKKNDNALWKSPNGGISGDEFLYRGHSHSVSLWNTTKGTNSIDAPHTIEMAEMSKAGSVYQHEKPLVTNWRKK